MTRLGVNIDHVATVRQARKTTEPDPVWAAVLAELGGADGITVHLREDRRHIQDRDVRILKDTVGVKLNLECACVVEMVQIARQIRPDQVCLVPERREEITTEGGLDVAGKLESVKRATGELQNDGIQVSLFIDPSFAQIDATAHTGASSVELHTGSYAGAQLTQRAVQLETLSSAALHAADHRLAVHAGHGLTYNNVKPVAEIALIEELNIGHSIISRAIMVGLTQAVREMKQLLV